MAGMIGEVNCRVQQAVGGKLKSGLMP